MRQLKITKHKFSTASKVATGSATSRVVPQSTEKYSSPGFHRDEMTRIFVQNRDGLIFALMGAIKMQTRYVRVLPTEVAVHVDDRAGYLTNLSLTGALVRMDTAIPVGLPVTFRLAGDRLAMTLNAAVRRNEQRDGAAGWWVALQFVNVSDREKRTIPRLIASAPFPSTAPHSHSLQARD